MHPVDESAAVATLIDTDEPREMVATRFRVSEWHIKKSRG
jgi:hypothetical protein